MTDLAALFSTSPSASRRSSIIPFEMALRFSGRSRVIIARSSETSSLSVLYAIRYNLRRCSPPLEAGNVTLMRFYPQRILGPDFLCQRDHRREGFISNSGVRAACK